MQLLAAEPLVFFAALRVAEHAKINKLPIEVNIFESSSRFLKKVKISGGGRCNVTHYSFDPKEFLKNYPRGQRELISPFQRFQALDTVNWFKKRGITLVSESDGRMFPDTNSSETIIQCFTSEAKRLNIGIHSLSAVTKVAKAKNGFCLKIGNESTEFCDFLIVATGSSKSGYELVKTLGHKMTDLAPSLFSFKINHKLLSNMAGQSFQNSMLTLSMKSNCKLKFSQSGPLLITHWGLSGPAILKLSAWAARELKKSQYQAELIVNWLGLKSKNDLDQFIENHKNKYSKQLIKNNPIPGFSKRFWIQFLKEAPGVAKLQWSELSNKYKNSLIEALFQFKFLVTGKNRFKEEFVECGGVDLKEINFKSMESKIVKNLYITGELLDVDGVTGGFNFQNAWTTAWIAGTHIVDRQLTPLKEPDDKSKE